MFVSAFLIAKDCIEVIGWVIMMLAVSELDLDWWKRRDNKDGLGTCLRGGASVGAKIISCWGGYFSGVGFYCL